MRILRRCLVTVLGLGLLTGCAFSDPMIDGTPTPVQLDPTLAAQVAQGLTIADQVAAFIGSTASDSPNVATMLETLSAQRTVIAGPAPLDRLSVDLAGGSTPSSANPSPKSWSSADDAFADLRDTYATLAGQSTNVGAGLWASLAASAEQMRLGLVSGYGLPTPANASRTVTPTTEAEAVTALISRYHEQIFLLESGIGYIASADQDRPKLSGVLASLKSHRDSLISLAEAMSVDVPQSAGIYALPDGRDKQACLDIVSTAQTVLSQAAAVWVVSATSPDQATPELIFTATIGSPFGLGAAVWPGWPDE